MLSAISGAPPAEMPTTKVGIPAALAAVTAATAPGVSSAIVLLPLAGQFGWPSVASTMNFGFWSASPRRYVEAAFSAARVGVELPMVTLLFASVRAASAAAIAAAFIGPIGTAAFAVTPHALLF